MANDDDAKKLPPIPSDETYRGYVPGEPFRVKKRENRKVMPKSEIATGTDDDPLTW